MRDWIRSSGLAGVLLVLIELLVFLLALSFLAEIARGDDISDQIQDIDTYVAVIREIEASDTASIAGTTIICDEIEINHVYRQVEADVVSHRLDQVLVRNRKHVPRQLDSNGYIIEEAGWLRLIDGWSILSNCRRYDNPVDRKAWETSLSNTLRGYPEIEKATIWSKTKYWGEFISPVTKVGDYHVLRLTDWNGTVTIKSRFLRYTSSLIDLETEERKYRGNNRKFNLNQMKNAPTVIGEAAVRK